MRNSVSAAAPSKPSLDTASAHAASRTAAMDLIDSSKAWNGADERALKAINKAGIEITDAPDALLESIKSMAAVREAAWAEAVSKDGFDGAAALTELRTQTGVEY